MSTAKTIVSATDRTKKEKRDWAEFLNIGGVDFDGDVNICHFKDGSSLMMTLDENFKPTEFLAIAPPYFDDAIAHAEKCISKTEGWDSETLSFNVESNFPDLTIDQCYEVAEIALAA